MLTCARNAVLAGAARQRGNGKVDIFVSVTSTGSKSSVKSTFSNINMSTIEEDLNSVPDIGDVVVKEFDSSGADIGPFIKMLAHGDIASRNYDFVLKMHSNGDKVAMFRKNCKICKLKTTNIKALKTKFYICFIIFNNEKKSFNFFRDHHSTKS